MKTFLSLALVLGSCLLANAADWTTDYPAALAKAKAEKKLVLLDFTGSDWCGACMLLDKEVFPTPTFGNFAKKNYILVTVDLPQQKQLPNALQEQNQALSDKFGVDVFPTLLVVDPSGKELGRAIGYDPGSGPDAVVEKLKTFSK